MFILASFMIAMVYGQQQTCEYKDPNYPNYLLNLTAIEYWRLEYQSPNHFFYYTPCRNGEQCRQGNANFYGNAVQYQPGSNICQHYLSVDHHESPRYFFGTAAWIFEYADGEKCDTTQEPRRNNVYMICDEFMNSPARLYDVEEPQPCRYAFTVRTPQACVPEERHNANCQWRYATGTNGSYVRLDLSSLKGRIIHGPISQNGYEQYYSPCQNGLHCYQQTGHDVMSILENRVTGTCEHYLSEWQEGRVGPLYHGNDPNQIHWSFHYYLNEKCSDGTQGEQTIRWYCDQSVGNFSVINATYDGNCRWEMNIKSQYACPNNQHYTHYQGFDMRKLVGKGIEKDRKWGKKAIDRLIHL